jgi:hypothetical protein
VGVTTYVVVDIEADGPLLGVNSMRSIGAVIVKNLCVVDSFYVNIVSHGEQDPDTMNFWAQHKEAYAALLVQPKGPLRATQSFYDWLRSFEPPYVFVSDTNWFDYPWIKWYLRRYIHRDWVFERQECYPDTARLLDIDIPHVRPKLQHHALYDAQAIATEFIYLQKRLSVKEMA